MEGATIWGEPDTDTSILADLGEKRKEERKRKAREKVQTHTQSLPGIKRH